MITVRNPQIWIKYDSVVEDDPYYMHTGVSWGRWTTDIVRKREFDRERKPEREIVKIEFVSEYIIIIYRVLYLRIYSHLSINTTD